jgi:hypothetical protein
MIGITLQEFFLEKKNYLEKCLPSIRIPTKEYRPTTLKKDRVGCSK